MSNISLPFGITALRHDFSIPVGPGRSLLRWVYSFVLLGEHRLAIDAGVRGSAEAILEAAGGGLEMLFLTHAHPDHLGGARSLREMSHCQVAASALERSWIETPEVQLEARPVPGFRDLVEGGVAVDSVLDDGTRFPEAPVAPVLEVVATPGHSPGHLSFRYAGGVLFAGDAVPVPGELPIYDDARATVRSLERLRSIPVDLLLSAWDEPREGAEASRAIDRGLEVVRACQHAVDRVRAALPEADEEAMTVAVAGALGLSPQLAGPMLARTVRAHLASP